MTSLSQLTRCFRTSRTLQRYLDGETDDPTAERVAEHLGQCRRCGLQARTHAAIKQSLAAGDHDVDDLTLRRLRAFSRSLSEQEGPDGAIMISRRHTPTGPQHRLDARGVDGQTPGMINEGPR